MGYLFIALAATLWGLLGPVSKYIFEQGISPLETAFWRAILASVFFATHSILTKKTTLKRTQYLPVVGFGLVGVSVFFSVYQLAIQAGGAAVASVLLYTAPAWVAVMAWAFLREKISGDKLAAIVLTLIGVSAISLQRGSGQVSSSAVFWGLLSGLSYAMYYIFGKKFFARLSSQTLMMYALPIGALSLVPYVHFQSKTAMAWAALGFLSFISTYLSGLAYFAGLKRTSATAASVVATLEPVVAAGVAWIWWGERFTLLGYLGALLILAGVVWVSIRGRE